MTNVFPIELFGSGSEVLLLSMPLLLVVANKMQNGTKNTKSKDETPLRRLAQCGDRHSCVSTLAENANQRLDAIGYTGQWEDAKATLVRILNEMERVTWVTDEGEYMHLEFRTRLLRFVDDVEFVIDDGSKQIHFRSASRVGKGDLGVNRRRMARIRQAFHRSQLRA
jgi:uncharacterized protein (DUF1499 family)